MFYLYVCVAQHSDALAFISVHSRSFADSGFFNFSRQIQGQDDQCNDTLGLVTPFSISSGVASRTSSIVTENLAVLPASG